MKSSDVLQRAAAAERPAPRASSTLKSRLFSALCDEQASSGPLMSLAHCKSAGGKLCVFEELVAISPIGEGLKSRNPCNVCHARLLGEHVENAPIYWPGCPYVQFQNR
ncbi:MAG: hypothetical protein FJW40_16640 [Acidobacteria bacterium]|nr:hypothetical protein [Acidobacteriota bacterium]